MYKLDKDFIKGNVQKASLRKAFGHGLAGAAKNNDKVVALTADLGSSVGLGEFHEQLPERFIETGIEEQNLVTLASGMAHAGKIPFVAAYAAFSPGRNWEQIRTTICLNNQPVKIVGSHTGVNVGPDGATHQMLEDIALMRVLPNMTVIAPGDAVEAEKVARALVKYDHPAYVRLPRADFPTFSADDAPFEVGKAYVVCPDDEASITIISTGSMTGNAMLSANRLAEQGINASVVHVPTIKPLDRETILREVGKNSICVTVEEHQATGGLGSAVAELLLEAGVTPRIFKRLAINDKYGQSGTCDELLSYYKLDVEGITNQIMMLLNQ